MEPTCRRGDWESTTDRADRSHTLMPRNCKITNTQLKIVHDFTATKNSFSKAVLLQRFDPFSTFLQERQHKALRALHNSSSFPRLLRFRTNFELKKMIIVDRFWPKDYSPTHTSYSKAKNTRALTSFAKTISFEFMLAEDRVGYCGEVTTLCSLWFQDGTAGFWELLKSSCFAYQAMIRAWLKH